MKFPKKNTHTHTLNIVRQQRTLPQLHNKPTKILTPITWKYTEQPKKRTMVLVLYKSKKKKNIHKKDWTNNGWEEYKKNLKNKRKCHKICLAKKNEIYMTVLKCKEIGKNRQQQQRIMEI